MYLRCDTIVVCIAYLSTGSTCIPNASLILSISRLSGFRRLSCLVLHILHSSSIHLHLTYIVALCQLESSNDIPLLRVHANCTKQSHCPSQPASGSPLHAFCLLAKCDYPLEANKVYQVDDVHGWLACQ